MKVRELKQIVENYNNEASLHNAELLHSRAISYTNGPESAQAKRDLVWREQRVADARPPVFNIAGKQYTGDQLSRLADNDDQDIDEVIEKVTGMNTLH